jgi:hypothetical protein
MIIYHLIYLWDLFIAEGPERRGSPCIPGGTGPCATRQEDDFLQAGEWSKNLSVKQESDDTGEGMDGNHKNYLKKQMDRAGIEPAASTMPR